MTGRCLCVKGIMLVVNINLYMSVYVRMSAQNTHIPHANVTLHIITVHFFVFYGYIRLEQMRLNMVDLTRVWLSYWSVIPLVQKRDAILFLLKWSLLYFCFFLGISGNIILLAIVLFDFQNYIVTCLSEILIIEQNK